jgi:hypothetical protein
MRMTPAIRGECSHARTTQAAPDRYAQSRGLPSRTTDAPMPLPDQEPRAAFHCQSPRITKKASFYEIKARPVDVVFEYGLCTVLNKPGQVFGRNLPLDLIRAIASAGRIGLGSAERSASRSSGKYLMNRFRFASAISHQFPVVKHHRQIRSIGTYRACPLASSKQLQRQPGRLTRLCQFRAIRTGRYRGPTSSGQVLLPRL